MRSNKLMNLELEIRRNEFRDTYKKYVLLTKGEWTKADEEKLENEIKEIESRANLFAFLLIVLSFFIFIIIVSMLIKLFGV